VSLCPKVNIWTLIRFIGTLRPEDCTLQVLCLPSDMKIDRDSPLLRLYHSLCAKFVSFAASRPLGTVESLELFRAHSMAFVGVEDFDFTHQRTLFEEYKHNN
jgi:hypothetical protein